jgi:SAM-dependent methyltransferase
MPDHRQIYRLEPERYDELVRCEDRDGNLLPCLRRLVPLEGADVVELGAGTGRVTRQLAPLVGSLRAFDAEPAMLEVARRALSRLGAGRWELAVADNARLPLPDACADLALAGWTFGHQALWDETGWRSAVEAALGELLRVLRPGGTAVVIETLGTCREVPFTPPPELARYYALLEGERGFARTWIRTDFEFASPAEGERLVRFFFGEELAREVAARGDRVVPECTGVWWRRR